MPWLEGKEEGRQEQGRTLAAVRTAGTKAPAQYREGLPGAQGSGHPEHLSLQREEGGQGRTAETILKGPPVPEEVGIPVGGRERVAKAEERVG